LTAFATHQNETSNVKIKKTSKQG